MFTKAARVLQYQVDKEGFSLELDSFNSIGEQYLKNKSKILEMMGGKQIIEKEEELVIKVDDEVKDLGYNQFMRHLIEIPFFKNIYALRRFIRECGAIAFYDNKTTEELSYRIITDKDIEKIIRIPQGMKITRAMKFFVSDEKVLYKLQTKYSQIINTSEITGKMCVSCHPLDYLSMSLNNNNWRSCMALDGEYAAGTLSYVCDDSTIIVYLKSDKEDEVIKCFPSDVKWNSKKWRCLLYFDKEKKMIVSTKQYPFSSSKLIHEAMDFVKEALHLENWENKIVDSLFDLNTFLGSEGLIFNDLEANNGKIDINCLCDKSSIGDDKKIIPGADVVCPICGEQHIDYGGSFVCSGCADRRVCENCGESIGGDEESYFVDGIEICENCMTECCCMCECCYEIFWVDDEELVWTEDGTPYCSCCYESLYEE